MPHETQLTKNSPSSERHVTELRKTNDKGFGFILIALDPSHTATSSRLDRLGRVIRCNLLQTSELNHSQWSQEARHPGKTSGRERGGTLEDIDHISFFNQGHNARNDIEIKTIPNWAGK